MQYERDDPMVIKAEQMAKNAKEEWYKVNREPVELDFVCPRCDAQPGENCVIKRGKHQFHISRVDRCIVAFNNRTMEGYSIEEKAFRECFRELKFAELAKE